MHQATKIIPLLNNGNLKYLFGFGETSFSNPTLEIPTTEWVYCDKNENKHSATNGLLKDHLPKSSFWSLHLILLFRKCQYLVPIVRDDDHVPFSIPRDHCPPTAHPLDTVRITLYKHVFNDKYHLRSHL